jgi:glucose-1-phosphate thymidylyltransferase
MRGIVLAGGTGSRLWPMTKSVSKQLLPIYDKPLIYYPISTLMLADIREILIITTPQDLNSFKTLLGDGSQYGVSFQFATQEKPNGLAEALIIAEEFLNGDKSMMILGDNFFHGDGLGQELKNVKDVNGCHIFLTRVSNPSDYGVLTLDTNDQPISIVEKPKNAISPWAVTGMYVFDNQASQFARGITKSARGELEITSVLEKYLGQGSLGYSILARGKTWLDTGTPENLLEASNFVRILEQRTGLKIACLEEIAWGNGWISDIDLKNCTKNVGKAYGEYLLGLLPE